MHFASVTVLLFLVVSVLSETTQAPSQVPDQTDKLSESIQQNGIEQMVPKEKPVEVSLSSESIPSPMNIVRALPVGRPLMQSPVKEVLGPFQRQSPPFFGYPFRPSIIRSQPSTLMAFPPQEQPVFDSVFCQQDPNSKRDLEKRSPSYRHLEGFYLNSKNQDVVFSLCGDLTPAHLIVIESISPKLEKAISTLKNINNTPVVINDISDLLNLSKRTELESATVLPIAELSTVANCTNDRFREAFKIFLKFFYVGAQALDDIQSLEVGFLVWRLGVAYLDIELVHSQIEPRIGNLIRLDNLSQVFRFSRDNQIAYLDKRWSDFVNANSRVLSETGKLPINCEDIQGDIVYLDRFIEALNVNQSITISYIRQYLKTCPESSNFSVTGSNQFPRSLIYFRCTIQDLKELLKMGFINYENLAEELETRLNTQERHCEEKCATGKFAPVMSSNYHHVISLNPGASRSVGRRA